MTEPIDYESWSQEDLKHARQELFSSLEHYQNQHKALATELQLLHQKLNELKRDRDAAKTQYTLVNNALKVVNRRANGGH